MSQASEIIGRLANDPHDVREISLTPQQHSGVFVVVPAYNEAPSVGGVVTALHALYPNVVVVDDGSSDDTGETARRAGAMVLRHVINRGQGAAIQTGIEFALRAGAGCVVTFDADGQHDPADIERLLLPVVRGECDVALGSRFLGQAEGITAMRRLTLQMGVWFTWLTSGVRLTDAHNGLRAFSRRAAEVVDIRLDGMAHASELVDIIRRHGLSFREVPVTIRYTDYSRTKGQSAGGALRIVMHYLIGRVTR